MGSVYGFVFKFTGFLFLLKRNLLIETPGWMSVCGEIGVVFILYCFMSKSNHLFWGIAGFSPLESTHSHLKFVYAFHLTLMPLSWFVKCQLPLSSLYMLLLLLFFLNMWHKYAFLGIVFSTGDEFGITWLTDPWPSSDVPNTRQCSINWISFRAQVGVSKVTNSVCVWKLGVRIL